MCTELEKNDQLGKRGSPNNRVGRKYLGKILVCTVKSKFFI